jgi:hypothetical protein
MSSNIARQRMTSYGTSAQAGKNGDIPTKNLYMEIVFNTDKEG